MHIVHGILHLLWHIVTIPFHLLATVIKIVIIGPLVLIVTLACLVFGCIALVSPSTLSSIHIAPPDLLGIATSLLQHTVISTHPNGQPAQVTVATHGNAIVVSWAGDPSGAQWYEVLRSAVSDATWRRIAIVPAASASDGHYQYADTDLQHGVTYRYAITAVTSSGGEGTPVESALQVVAP
jgi:hypothetical protein